MQEFADLVIDRLLARAAELFPETAPAVALTANAPGPPAPATGGAMAASVATASGELARLHSVVRRTDEVAAQALAAAGQAGVDARREAELRREQARAQVSAILPMTNSAAGMRLLVSALDEHVRAVQARMEIVRAANSAAAEQLRGVAAAYHG